MPSGYNLMRIALLKAFVAEKSAEAEKYLNDVEIAGNDFQWLHDIRLLAKCSLAHTFGDRQKEEKLKKEFYLKQPLLFEPEHVFDFRLVSYQELLKKEYQNQRKQSR